MRFYKLELVNREQSYNAMFGANPKVGFIDQTAKPPGIPRKTTQRV